jgi:hypothetical protein
MFLRHQGFLPAARARHSKVLLSNRAGDARDGLQIVGGRREPEPAAPPSFVLSPSDSLIGNR